MSDAITVTDLVVRRGKAIVLKSLTCRAAAGRITGLLGPSGSGKTTLIRAIVGVQVVRSGTVTVLGEPAGSRLLRDRIGYVSQAPSIYPDLTVLENARYFAAIAGTDHAAARAQSSRSDWPPRPGSWSSTSPAGSGPGRRWPARSSATRRSWCWTSRRSVRTRCSARSCGTSSGSGRGPGRPCWCPRT